jgi:hypothetical protein
LLVAIIPSPLQVYPGVYGPLLKNTFPDSRLVDDWLDDRTRPQTIMGGMCRDLGIPFLDLFPVLEADDHDVLFIPREGHFTERAHFIVAQSLASFILENLD